jgi:hypothetical protein
MTKVEQGVPNADVPALKALWESEGYTVTVSDNGDGTSDVTATDAAAGA